MKHWYQGEPIRLLPNIEVTHNADDELVYFSLVWLRFVIDLPFCLIWKNRKQYIGKSDK